MIFIKERALVSLFLNTQLLLMVKNVDDEFQYVALVFKNGYNVVKTARLFKDDLCFENERYTIRQPVAQELTFSRRLEMVTAVYSNDSNNLICIATDLKAQQALHGGRLKDVVVIKSIEEYESYFGDEENFTNLMESMQEGEYILMFILNADLGNGEKASTISTIVKENDSLEVYEDFTTEVIDEKIYTALLPITKQLEAITPTINTKQDMS